MKYCLYPFKTKRFLTREITVGSVKVGGQNPVRIQSMTTSPTDDVEKTVEQIIRLADSGCEIARVTVQGMKEAYSCEAIKSSLIQKGYDIPLVADIHFFPKAALCVADFVDKVRINPGNYVDKRATFKVLEYTDETYLEELVRLEEKFLPLIEKCKKNQVALRIGTNHGSLSDRVMNRFGDSPLGMVESALEYAQVCRKYDFHNFIFSMKASNTHVMIQAYRLLVARMMEMQWDYPLHLGVTEAGSGDDGRIKSAVGIGSLLLDGLGDTIRVSLTEDPWHEIDPCKRLVKLAEAYEAQKEHAPFVEKYRNPLEYKKHTVLFDQKPLKSDGLVYVPIKQEDLLKPHFLEDLGLEEVESGWEKSLKSVDAVLLEEKIESPQALELIEQIKNLGVVVFSETDSPIKTHSFIRVTDETAQSFDFNKMADAYLLAFTHDVLHQVRAFVERYHKEGSKTPIILEYRGKLSREDLCISIGAEYGSLLCDGLAQGLLIDSKLSLKENRELALNCLQACRLRSSKTEFISCPSCGRTLFDLQTVTKEIQKKTAHLPGVKIAVMGCIVNGPGEMADADFGYVGSKPGKIDLYVGKTRVQKDIDHHEAVERLVDLLKEHNVWIEPSLNQKTVEQNV